MELIVEVFLCEYYFYKKNDVFYDIIVQYLR